MIRRVIANLLRRLKRKKGRKEVGIVFFPGIFLSDLRSSDIMRPCRKGLFKEYVQYLEELKKKDVFFFLTGDIVQDIPQGQSKTSFSISRRKA